MGDRGPYVGKRVRIDGLTSKPELNGEEGVGVSFDPAKCRTNVRLADGRVIALRPSNLIEVRGREPDGGGADLLGDLRDHLPEGLTLPHAALLAAGAAFVAYRALGLAPRRRARRKSVMRWYSASSLCALRAMLI